MKILPYSLCMNYEETKFFTAIGELQLLKLCERLICKLKNRTSQPQITGSRIIEKCFHGFRVGSMFVPCTARMAGVGTTPTSFCLTRRSASSSALLSGTRPSPLSWLITSRSWMKTVRRLYPYTVGTNECNPDIQCHGILVAGPGILGGVNRPSRVFCLQFVNSYGPAFSRTLNPSPWRIPRSSPVYWCRYPQLIWLCSRVCVMLIHYLVMCPNYRGATWWMIAELIIIAAILPHSPLWDPMYCYSVKLLSCQEWSLPVPTTLETLTTTEIEVFDNTTSNDTIQTTMMETTTMYDVTTIGVHNVTDEPEIPPNPIFLCPSTTKCGTCIESFADHNGITYIWIIMYK